MIAKKEIVFCDSRGQLGLLENVTQQEMGASDQVKSSSSPMDVSFPNDNDDIDEAEISVTQIKKNTGFVVDKENGQDIFTGVRPAAIGMLSTTLNLNDKLAHLTYIPCHNAW